MSQYLKFFLMIATSTLVMFVLMYLNTYQLSHVFFSETRTYMALYMGAMMAVIMLLFMLNMYKDKKKNITVLIASVTVFAGSLFLVRSKIKDKRVQELATNIIEAQRREIKEMQWLLKDIEKNGLAETQEQAQSRTVPDFNAK